MKRSTIGMILMMILSAIVIFGISIGMAGKADARPVHHHLHGVVAWDPPRGCRDCTPCTRPWMTVCKDKGTKTFVVRRFAR